MSEKSLSIELIDIGREKLEVCKVGQGSPVIVIETGMCSTFYDWFPVIKELSEKATVITYHRAGYGESTLNKELRTTEQIVDDLKELLNKLGIDEKIILVGHSFGGLCTQHFAKLYPEKIAGIVLVDSVPMQQYRIEEAREISPNILAKYPYERLIKIWSPLSEKSHDELYETINPKLSEEQKKFPEGFQKRLLNFFIKPNFYKAILSEYENMEQCGREIENLAKFPNIPLKVLCSDEDLAVNSLLNANIPEEEARNFQAVVHNLKEKTAEYSTKGEFIYAKNCNHNIHIDDPALVVKVIEALIK